MAFRRLLVPTELSLAFEFRMPLPASSHIVYSEPPKANNWWHRTSICLNGSLRKVWASIKFLSAKFGLPPPPRKGPEMRKNSTNQYKILKIDTFSGGKRDFVDKIIFWTSGRF